jgi:predicted HTH transcriptional regulator
VNLVEVFESMTLKDLDNFINTGQEENIYLDFKLVNKADLSNADDKRNLAKALSGFSNSSGGLIVWGVEARKNPQGIDCAVGKKDIESIQLFISRLNEFTGMAVSPIVAGVFHKPIPSSGDKGFAVTFVPENDSGPHMAKMREDRYYKRSGASFYRMEHFDLEDMFGRCKKPKLTLSTRIAGKRPNVAILLGIKNDGRGTAKGSVSSLYYT